MKADLRLRTAIRTVAVLLLGFAIGVAISGCATAPPSSSEAVAAADYAVRTALENGAAPLYARNELEAAQRKLGEAKFAARKGQEALATRLAEEAEVDAILAAALGAKARAEKRLGDVRRISRSLRSDRLEESGIPE